MSIDYIGPVSVDVRRPKVSWGTASDGLRDASITGAFHKGSEAQMIQELVNRPTRDQQSFGDRSGVLAVVWTSGNLSDYRGWYLLEDVEVDTDVEREAADLIGFKLVAVYLGANREPVVTRSARKRANDFSLTAKSLVVQPFWGEDSDGEPFITDPGGTAFSREYDARTDYNPSSPTTTGRHLRIHEGEVT